MNVRGTSHRTLLAGVLLALPLLLAAYTPSVDAATTTRTLAITEDVAKPTVPWKAFDGNPPKVFDINGDGQLEIIAQNDNQWAYIFDSKTGRMLAELKTALPSHWGARSFNGPEVAILEEGKDVRVVLANSAAVITSFRFDPSGSTSTRFLLLKEWEVRLDDCYSNPGMDARPVFADLDKDGRLEILGATEESGVYALRANGAIMWKNCLGGGNAEPSVADLDQDGWPDIVHVSDGGTVSALKGRTGGWMWSFNVRTKFGLGSGSIPVPAGIGQLDGRGGPDIVVGARDSHNPDDWTQNHAILVALSSTGSLLWAKQDPNGNPLTYTRPVIGDADKDGRNEVYWADWNTVGHKPPPPDSPDAWKVTGPANFYRYAADGVREWKQSLGTWWNNKDVPVGDVDGDGRQEMLANGPHNGHDGIWYLNTDTGAKEAFVDTYPWKVFRAPVLADLWNTGTTQWVVQTGPITSSAGHAILVYDTKSPFNSIWPHVPYPGTPDEGGTPPPPPPPEGFDATFSGVGGNEWWIQSQVSASGGTLAKVDVRLNGGSWKPLENKGWGWAASYHAPSGTIVQLRATSTAGETDPSGCYRWTAATATTCPDEAPPPSGFDATFSGVGGNEWWIQSQVSASGGTLAKVDVSLNGGSWKPLQDHGWGWGASYHTPSGTIVQLRATSTTGETDPSGCYRWTAASVVSCSDSTFAPTFQPRSAGNDWWVEVAISGATNVAAVDANIDGGTWRALDKTDWGTWAKSFHVPNGSDVRFRATSTSGEVAVSSPYDWP